MIVTSMPERDALRQNNDDNNGPDMIQRSSTAILPTDSSLVYIIEQKFNFCVSRFLVFPYLRRH